MPRRRALRVLGGALVGLAPAGGAGEGASAPSTHDCPNRDAERLPLRLPEYQRALLQELLPEPDARLPGTRASARRRRTDTRRAAPLLSRDPAGRRAARNKCCDAGEFCANPATQLCCKQGERACAGHFCCASNEECVTASHQGLGEHLRKAMPLRARPGAGDGKCCPPKMALPEPEHGPLQAVPPERGGVREQVLRSEHVALLRQGRVLPEEPILLRQRQEAGVLPAADEVRRPDPPREHRRQAGDGGDLLSAGAPQQQPEALLPGRPGGAQQSRACASRRPV